MCVCAQNHLNVQNRKRWETNGLSHRSVISIWEQLCSQIVTLARGRKGMQLAFIMFCKMPLQEILQL